MAESTKETTRTDWNERNKQIFVHAMVNEAAKVNFVDNGFKKLPMSSERIQAVYMIHLNFTATTLF